MNFGPFTSWDPLLKGQESDQNLISLAELIENIPPSYLKFTSINTDGSLEECFLGSAEGNTKFLMGFCNPGFHLAPYHYQIMNPTLSTEQAQYIYELKGHPSIPELWVDSGNIPVPEGDLKNGTPHPFFGGFRSKAPKAPSLLIGGETYLLDVNSRELTNLETQISLPWEVIEACPQFYIYPELANQVVPQPEDLNSDNKEETSNPEDEDSSVYKGMSFSDNCFPLVKSLFPKPGTIVKLEDDLFGLITPSKVKFFGKINKASKFSDFELSELSLEDTEDNITSSSLMEFAESVLGNKLELINE